jgi:hypothetical protein
MDVSVKFVPQLLTKKQKWIHLSVAYDLLEHVETYQNFLKITVIGN